MKIEIISTGQEVLTGAVVDSNAAYIARVLRDAGGEIVRHSCVGDDLKALSEVFREAKNRAGCVVVTGGLGPTQDDLTAQAAAEFAGCELMHDPEAERSVTDYFRMKSMAVPGSNRKQMLLPDGADCLYNAVGTAPGFILRKDDCTFFFIPGVPSEMRHMMSTFVVPAIEAMAGERLFHRVKTLSHFGIPEAEVDSRLSGIEKRFPEISLGLQASFPVIHAKLYHSGTDEAAVNDLLEKAAAWTMERTGHAVFSTEGLSMQEEVGRLLVKAGRTVALAESCTGGLIGHMLTGVAGSSAYFLFSGVTYSNDAKIRVLGVNRETLDRYGAVSPETVKEMAMGARQVSGADYGVATSGIAGPDGGTPLKPVGTLCIGIATADGARAYSICARFSDREKNKAAFAMKALDLLRRTLLDD